MEGSSASVMIRNGWSAVVGYLMTFGAVLVGAESRDQDQSEKTISSIARTSGSMGEVDSSELTAG